MEEISVCRCLQKLGNFSKCFKPLISVRRQKDFLGQPSWFIYRTWSIYNTFLTRIFSQRPYHAECTSSRPITEVKQHWALLVLGWETAWEHRVLLAFCNFTCRSFYSLNVINIIIRLRVVLSRPANCAVLCLIFGSSTSASFLLRRYQSFHHHHCHHHPQQPLTLPSHAYPWGQEPENQGTHFSFFPPTKRHIVLVTPRKQPSAGARKSGHPF